MINHINIGPMKYTVMDVDGLVDNTCDPPKNLDGWVKYRDATIEVETHLSPEYRPLVVWHEVMHVLFEQLGAVQDEGFINALSYKVAETVGRNWEFWKQLHG